MRVPRIRSGVTEYLVPPLPPSEKFVTPQIPEDVASPHKYNDIIMEVSWCPYQIY